MKDSESIKEIVNQVVVQVAMLVMQALRDTNTAPEPATMPNQWKIRDKEMKGRGQLSQDLSGAYQIGVLNC